MRALTQARTQGTHARHARTYELPPIPKFVLFQKDEATIQAPLAMSTLKYIDAEPYKWPYNGNLTPENTCIIVIGKILS